ncbi:MAG: hypothetical protein N4A35_16310 [Flavobacteriales bacterium]|jgi:thymidylate kinase|nr:hypothetical protein [Flavobacteriales bacterium]
MKENLRLSDLDILLKTLIGEEYQLFVFDPYLKLESDIAFDLKKTNEKAPLVLVNLAGEIVGYKNMDLTEFDYIFDFENQNTNPNFKKTTFSYIANNDGSMRWVYPKENKSASFLNFYNASTLKAKLMSQSIRTAFFLGMGSLVAKSKFTILHKKELKPNKDYALLAHKTYSIFTGTAGLNRTALIELSTKGQSTHFIKIPIAKTSQKLIAKETEVLQQIKGKFKTFKIPQVFSVSNLNECVTTNEELKNKTRSNDLLKPHFEALNELLVKTAESKSIEACSVYQNGKNNVAFIEAHAKTPRHERMVRLLKGVMEQLNPEDEIVTSMAHGDFTPWNMFVNESELYVYDWELARKNFSPLFDLFHFHFQTGILVEKIALSVILNKIEKSLSNPTLQKQINKLNIDTDVALKLYLLGVVSYYEALYLKQGTHSLQNQWQFRMWEEALLYLNRNKEMKQSINCREEFILELGNRLEKTPYAMLKMVEEEWTKISESSDLDIAVLKGDVNNIKSFSVKHPLVIKSIVKEKSFMTIIQLFFRDGTFLSIDLIHQFKRKTLDMFASSLMFKNRRRTGGNVYKPSLKNDFEYSFLFYTLNGADTPQKYQDFYNQKITHPEQDTILHYLNNKYGLKAKTFKSLFNYSSEFRQQLMQELIDRDENRGWNRLKNNYNYLLDTIRDLKLNKGMIITFSGVDGAGKTTVISNFKKLIEEKYRKDVVLVRHRPGLLPILSAVKHGKEKAEKEAGIKLPRQGKNKNIISSLLRFGYYFTDYIIGQFYIYFKYVLRGKVVLYDRYYFDFINDAKRSNIVLNRKFVKSLYALVWKPDLNFFLYADSEVILKRKQELKAQDIDVLTSRYQELFDGFNKRQTKGMYVAIQNHDFKDTMNAVESTFRKVS